MIRKLAETVKAGTKFFIDHGEGTNSHDNRNAVGEIISSYTSMVGDKLSNIVIGHFPNEGMVKDMDVCSIEAEVYTPNGDVVGDVDEVSGIALGNSQREHPAFPGAFRLGAIQCFEDNFGEKEKDMAGEAKITFETIKSAVRDMNIRPWQLFEKKDLEDDREFGTVFSENSTLKADNERLTKENDTIKTESQESVKKASIATANQRLDGLLKEGFTDKQKTFITKGFKPEEMSDTSDEGLAKYVESAKSNFAEFATIFGVTEEGSASKKVEKKEGDGDGANDEELTDDFEKALEEIGAK